MILLLSPAKSLNEAAAPISADTSALRFPRETAALLKVLKRKKPKDFMEMMEISEALAKLNTGRYKGFDDQPQKTAVLMFNGDVYLGLKAEELDAEALRFADQHIRILSGLYGLLRPLQPIRPYRLEMGTHLKTPKGETLYEFWGPKIAKAVTEDLKAMGSKTVVNLASTEYARAALVKGFKPKVITPRFLELKDNQAKIISFFAKKARGLMARYMIDQRLTEPEGLQGFDYEGYKFRPDLSKGDDWVFTRPQPPLKS